MCVYVCVRARVLLYVYLDTHRLLNALTILYTALLTQRITSRMPPISNSNIAASQLSWTEPWYRLNARTDLYVTYH
jgi:hypothetical protein